MENSEVPVPFDTLDRVRGMLMRLCSLVKDEETKTAIRDTISELDVAEEVSDVE